MIRTWKNFVYDSVLICTFCHLPFTDTLFYIILGPLEPTKTKDEES